MAYQLQVVNTGFSHPGIQKEQRKKTIALASEVVGPRPRCFFSVSDAIGGIQFKDLLMFLRKRTIFFCKWDTYHSHHGLLWKHHGTCTSPQRHQGEVNEDNLMTATIQADTSVTGWENCGKYIYILWSYLSLVIVYFG